MEDLVDDQLAGTTEDAPSETTTAIGDGDDTTSDTTAIDGVVAMAADETGTGAAWVWTSGTLAIAVCGTNTAEKDRRVLIRGSDVVGATGVSVTLDLFNRAEALRALTFFGDAGERLLTRRRTAPTFRRDLDG